MRSDFFDRSLALEVGEMTGLIRWKWGGEQVSGDAENGLEFAKEIDRRLLTR